MLPNLPLPFPPDLISRAVSGFMAAVALAGSLVNVPIGGSSLPLPALPAATASTAVGQQELIDALNRARAAHSLPAVAPHPELGAIAQDWAQQQAAHGSRTNLSHRPNFTAGYPAGWTRAGEVITGGAAPDSADALVQRWLDSPSHRATVLDPAFTHAGAGVAPRADGSKVAVANFARF
ncbi:CAP domain-containing protein [Corynebacterium timonense]|uniref:Uncharacterized conserved protein YkwD, contains CAP (CSP/antigen 5/PR1) domain n=1 Tax=Corynebacterium timonense TaxID=441500 RepID=A0A1H1L560_9CORY|nr:CAP domain-containing protein [Corynebacterium timonense]SDR69714.1 Uncharacterized conserved protein YkwD, contains CAP (CSP/antigen 5/PR1) domain [Corynebacterium timonense]